jgi:hypothetical protein
LTDIIVVVDDVFGKDDSVLIVERWWNGYI